MLSFLRGNRFAASIAILAFTGVWLICPCAPGDMGTASANGSAQVSPDPHACCKTKPGLDAAAMSCCPGEPVRDALVVVSSSMTPPAATEVVDAPSIEHAVPIAPAIGAVSFRPPLPVVLRV